MNWKMKLYKFKNSGILFLLLALSEITSCNSDKTSSRVEALPYYAEATFTPLWLESTDKKLDTPHRISSFSLVNQEGECITEETFANKIYVTDFFFTSCPGICPKMTKNMFALQNEFIDDEEVLLLSHSVTPKKDSISVLKNYASANGAISDKWHLVTGKQEDIYKLGRQDYFVEEDLGIQKELDDFLHTENFVLIDKNKHIRGIYNGLNKGSIQQIITDIRTLKNE